MSTLTRDDMFDIARTLVRNGCVVHQGPDDNVYRMKQKDRLIAQGVDMTETMQRACAMLLEETVNG